MKYILTVLLVMLLGCSEECCQAYEDKNESVAPVLIYQEDNFEDYVETEVNTLISEVRKSYYGNDEDELKELTKNHIKRCEENGYLAKVFKLDNTIVIQCIKTELIYENID